MFGRAQEKGIKIDVTERFKDRLVDEGYNPAYGARPLRRAIMRLLEDSMAERMLSGDIKARPCPPHWRGIHFLFWHVRKGKALQLRACNFALSTCSWPATNTV